MKSSIGAAVQALLRRFGLVLLQRKSHPSAAEFLQAYRSLGLSQERTYNHLYGINTTHIIMQLLSMGTVDAVVDVGANAGQFARKIRECGYTGLIISFEPIPECFAELRKLAEADGNWRVFPFALGAAIGIATLNIYQDNSFSSFHQTSQEARDRFRGLVDLSRTIEVPVETLDGAIAREFSNLKRLFLKIDTQGFELPVLQGAAQTIAVCSVILLETPGVSLYAGASSSAELDEHLRKHSFFPIHRIPLAFDPHYCTPVEYDSYYVRARGGGEHDG